MQSMAFRIRGLMLPLKLLGENEKIYLTGKHLSLS